MTLTIAFPIFSKCYIVALLVCVQEYPFITLKIFLDILIVVSWFESVRSTVKKNMNWRELKFNTEYFVIPFLKRRKYLEILSRKAAVYDINVCHQVPVVGKQRS